MNEHSSTDQAPIVSSAPSGGRDEEPEASAVDVTTVIDDAAPPKIDASDAEALARLKEHRAERRRRRRTRRAIVAAALIACAALIVIGATALSSRSERSAPPVTDRVTSGTFTSAIEDRGSLEARSSSVVSPTIDGTIAEVRVTEGQAVQQGDVVATISNDDLDAAVNSASRALKGAQADLASAQGALKQAKAASAEGGADTAGAQAAVSSAQREVESAQAALGQAQTKADARTVRAPISGSIVALNAKVGASLSEAGADAGRGTKALMQIADLSQMRVTLQVSEEDIAAVAPGQTASITFPAFESLKLEGAVCGIASSASTSAEASGSASLGAQSGGSGAVTFAVDILIDKPDPRLRPGMTAQVTLVTRRYDNVIMVPLTALQTRDGSSRVMVQTDPEQQGGAARDVVVYAKNADVAVIGRASGAAAADTEQDMAEAPLKQGDILVISGGEGTAGEGEATS